jgi:uncharacterized membrane protein YjfL (UPF0719 family)
MTDLVLSLLQLVVAVLLSGIAAYLAFFLFQWSTRDLDEALELRRGNLAVGIFLGAIVVATAIMLRPALEINSSVWDMGRSVVWRTLLAEAVQILVGLVVAVIGLLVALLLFASLTGGFDEIEELKRGNLAIAALLAGVTIGVAVMLSPAVASLMDLAASLLF